MKNDIAMSTPQLIVDNIQVGYAGKTVVQDVSFQLIPGEIACLLGPSGCGKTSVLRAIAGFEPLMQGQITLHGRVVGSATFSLPPEKRHIGMVFQDFALFPHLTVARNIGFGLQKLSRKQRQQRVDELLDLVELSPARDHYPHQLSGGQQQRVALARAMAPRPDILLLDEPFSSMDTELREQLARDVRHLLRQDGVTAIMVTHDQHEAFAMADQIGVLGQGRLLQWGNGYDLYHRPGSRFVADFIGQGVLIPGQIIADNKIQTELGIVSGTMTNAPVNGQQVHLLLRPDDIIHDDNSPLKAEIVARAFRGAVYLYTLKLQSGQKILCLVQSHHQHEVGEYLGIRLEADHLAVFPAFG